jgi:hypothetical protein
MKQIKTFYPLFIISLLFSTNCLTYYYKLPKLDLNISQLPEKKQVSTDNPIYFSGTFPFNPGEKFGRLQFKPESKSLLIEIEKLRPFKSNSSPLTCLLSVFTFSLFPCYTNGTETVHISLSSPYLYDRKKSVTQDIQKIEFGWFPLFIVSPFMGDRKPDTGNVLAILESESKIIEESERILSAVEKKKKEVKPLLQNPKDYPVILNDFATTDLSSTSFQLSSGKDLFIQVYNNSSKAIVQLDYKIASTNSYFKSKNESIVTLTNEELIQPGNFSQNIFFRDGNPRPNSLFVFMESLVITWEDGKKTSLVNNQVKKINVQVPATFIFDLRSNSF